MGANEAEIDDADYIVDLDDQPIAVAADVEDDPAVLQDACRAILRLHVRGLLPRGSPHRRIPSIKCRLDYSLILPPCKRNHILTQSTPGDDPHRSNR
jgi:hypothetical protein